VLLRYNLGRSLSNPRIGQFTDLGNFSILTSNHTGLNFYKSQKSVWNAFFLTEVGSNNTPINRLAFGSPCPVQNPLFSQIQNSNLRYDGQGGYNLDLIATDTITGLVTRLTDSVTIRNPVNADFNIVGQLCRGGTVNFLDNSTRNVPTSQLEYSWNFGRSGNPNDIQSTAANPSFVYDSAGVYTVRLRVSESSGCVDEVIKQIRIKSKPIPSIVPPTPSCSYDSITLVDQSVLNGDTIVTKVWTVFDPQGQVFGTSTSPQGKFSIPNAGNYTDTLRLISISGCDCVLYS
jgi:PKD repeat protein